ncbi:hypothetical protein Tco_0511794 [Tanacetum coccineum]
MEYFVKISKKARILELKQRHLKNTVLTSNKPYPSRKIRHICACTLQETTKKQSPIRHIQETSISRIHNIVIKYSGRYERGPYSKKHLIRFEDLLYYDPSIDPPPIAERSGFHHEEFADELAHIISPPEYDHFYFDIEADPGELTRLLRENISSKSVNLTKIKEDNELKPKTSTKELTIHELNDLRLLLSNYPSEIETLLSLPSGNEDKVFDPEIFIINGIHSFTRKFSRLLNDNFKIDKRHIFSKISSKTKSSVSFHPMDYGIRGESSK